MVTIHQGFVENIIKISFLVINFYKKNPKYLLVLPQNPLQDFYPMDLILLGLRHRLII
jgi:hypothetical protein